MGATMGEMHRSDADFIFDFSEHRARLEQHRSTLSVTTLTCGMQWRPPLGRGLR